MNKIWYPGSAHAPEEWAKYLQETYRGSWFYSDIHKYTEWNQLQGRRIIANTHEPLPAVITRQRFNILIISRHSGLRSFEEIKQSGILQSVAPQYFIYDPGTPRTGDIEQHLNEIDLFKSLGYFLVKIVVLPDLHHQYCEFKSLSTLE